MTPLEPTTRKRNQPIVYVLAPARAVFDVFASDYPWIDARYVTDADQIRGIKDALYAEIAPVPPSCEELRAELRGRFDEWKPTQHAMSCNVMRFAHAKVVKPGFFADPERKQHPKNRILCSCGWKT